MDVVSIRLLCSAVSKLERIRSARSWDAFITWLKSACEKSGVSYTTITSHLQPLLEERNKQLQETMNLSFTSSTSSQPAPAIPPAPKPKAAPKPRAKKAAAAALSMDSE